MTKQRVWPGICISVWLCHCGLIISKMQPVGLCVVYLMVLGLKQSYTVTVSLSFITLMGCLAMFSFLLLFLETHPMQYSMQILSRSISFSVFSSFWLVIEMVQKWRIFAFRSCHGLWRHGDSCLSGAASASHPHHCNKQCYGNGRVRKEDGNGGVWKIDREELEVWTHGSVWRQ